MSETWQCASIRPGMTVAPSSRATRAPGPAWARTASAEPTAAIRPSRTSMLRERSGLAIVTKVASSISTSIGLPLENEQLSFTVSARLVLCPRSIYAKATLGGGVMTQIAGRRMVAEIEGDFVVFLIGARFSKSHPLRSFADLGGRLGMKHMLDYL